MNLTIISGGQTGADQGALRAAKSRGVATGGVAPKGWKTEAGPSPWLANYGLTELDTADYKVRTQRCVDMADLVLWFGYAGSPGGFCTINAAASKGIPFLCDVHFDGPTDCARRLGSYSSCVLMVAGNRESKNPGIGARVEEFMGKVLDSLRAKA